MSFKRQRYACAAALFHSGTGTSAELALAIPRISLLLAICSEKGSPFQELFQCLILKLSFPAAVQCRRLIYLPCATTHDYSQAQGISHIKCAGHAR